MFEPDKFKFLPKNEIDRETIPIDHRAAGKETTKVRSPIDCHSPSSLRLYVEVGTHSRPAVAGRGGNAP